jgi:hypothetical protein
MEVSFRYDPESVIVAARRPMEPTPLSPPRPSEGVPDAGPSPTCRFVLLGASNLTVGWGTVLAALHRRVPGPVEVLAALGHGRAYGCESRLLWLRWLPAIDDCGLWRELDRRPPLPTYALVTDVGNDVGYGARAEAVVGWVEGCCRRLAAHGAEVVLTLPPRARIDRLARWQVRLAHSFFFPFRPLPAETVRRRVRELDEGLRRLAQGQGLELVEPDLAWYGLDPIHFRRGARRRAWEEILSRFPLPPPGDRGRPRLAAARGFPGLRAERVRLLGGMRLHTPQPACRYADGSTVSLY